MNWNNIESIIKNRLFNGEIHGEEKDIWAAVEKELPKKKRNGFLFYFLPLTFFGVFVLFGNSKSFVEGKNSRTNLLTYSSDFEHLSAFTLGVEQSDYIENEILEPGNDERESSQSKIEQAALRRISLNRNKVEIEKGEKKLDSKSDNFLNMSNVSLSSKTLAQSLDKTQVKETSIKVFPMALIQNNRIQQGQRFADFVKIESKNSVVNIKNKEINLDYKRSAFDLLSNDLFVNSICFYMGIGSNLSTLSGESMNYNGESKIQKRESLSLGVKLSKQFRNSPLKFSIGVDQLTSYWKIDVTNMYLENDPEFEETSIAYLGLDGEVTEETEEVLNETIIKNEYRVYSSLKTIRFPFDLNYIVTKNRMRYTISGGANFAVRDEFAGYIQPRNSVLDINPNSDLIKIERRNSSIRVEPKIALGLSYQFKAQVALNMNMEFSQSIGDVNFSDIDLNIESKSLIFTTGVVKKW